VWTAEANNDDLVIGNRILLKKADWFSWLCNMLHVHKGCDSAVLVRCIKNVLRVFTYINYKRILIKMERSSI